MQSLYGEVCEIGIYFLDLWKDSVIMLCSILCIIGMKCYLTNDIDIPRPRQCLGNWQIVSIPCFVSSACLTTFGKKWPDN